MTVRVRRQSLLALTRADGGRRQPGFRLTNSPPGAPRVHDDTNVRARSSTSRAPLHAPRAQRSHRAVTVDCAYGVRADVDATIPHVAGTRFSIARANDPALVCKSRGTKEVCCVRSRRCPMPVALWRASPRQTERVSRSGACRLCRRVAACQGLAVRRCDTPPEGSATSRRSRNRDRARLRESLRAVPAPMR